MGGKYYFDINYNLENILYILYIILETMFEWLAGNGNDYENLFWKEHYYLGGNHIRMYYFGGLSLSMLEDTRILSCGFV